MVIISVVKLDPFIKALKIEFTYSTPFTLKNLKLGIFLPFVQVTFGHMVGWMPRTIIT